MRRQLIALVIGAALVFGACGGDDDDDNGATSDDTTADTSADDGNGDAGGGSGITIEGFQFTNATVAPGATVDIENKDSSPHTVTADDDSFDSGNVSGSGSITAPDEAGEYPFHCDIHTSMTGTLTVEG
jgi:plastocyanin